jgi:hypothetical protein
MTETRTALRRKQGRVDFKKAILNTFYNNKLIIKIMKRIFLLWVCILAYIGVQTTHAQVDVTDWVTNTEFETDYSGWTITGTNANPKISVTAKGDGSVIEGTQGHLQVWGSPYSGNVSQSIAGLPGGNYTFRVGIYTVFTGSAYSYANNGQTVIESDVSAFYEVQGDVINDTLTIGVYVDGTGGLELDHVSLACNSIDKTQLSALIAEGEALYGNGSGTKAPELRAAIDAVNAVSGLEANSTELIEATLGLVRAISAYNKQIENEAFFAEKIVELEGLLDEAEALIGAHNSNNYPATAVQALEAVFTEAANAYDGETLTFDNIADYINRLQLAVNAYKASALGLKIKYTFDDVNGNIVTNAAGSEYNGTLYNEASVIPMGKYKVLSLGNGTGYLDIGSQAGYIFPTASNYTVSAYYRVDRNASLSGNGYFLWAFSSQELNTATTGQYFFYQLNGQRYGITYSGWDNDVQISLATAATKDEWAHVLYRQTGSVGELYINGALAGTNEELSLPSAFTATTLYNWIGRPPFSGDNYLKNTLVYDFRLYNQAVTDLQIAEFSGLVTDLNNEFAYGTAGDFSQLTALVTEYTAFLSSITIGDNVGEYPQQAVWDFEDVLSAAQVIVDENRASQFVIDAQIADLRAAYTALLAAVVSETNTLAEGEYYISLNDRYLNNPGKDALANTTSLTTANSGLRAKRNIGNESQIYRLSTVEPDPDANPGIFYYYISSTLVEAATADDEPLNRYLTDRAQYTETPLVAWHTFDILYDQTAYAVRCAQDATQYRGYWYYSESDERLAVQESNYTANYAFNFIPVKTVFDEEVARGRSVFNAAAVGTTGGEYSQSVYDAFGVALEAAEAVIAEEFTKENLFEYAAARKLFVKNDGSNEFGDGTGIIRVEPAQSDVSITGGDKRIRIASGNAAKAAVYSLTGTTVAQQAIASGETLIPVNPGLYIVRVSGNLTTVKKVIVR